MFKITRALSSKHINFPSKCLTRVGKLMLVQKDDNFSNKCLCCLLEIQHIRTILVERNGEISLKMFICFHSYNFLKRKRILLNKFSAI